MHIDRIQIHAIKANNWNPNEMEEQLFRSLVENIKQFGVLQPILIRSDMTIIKGEKRWRAALEAGEKDILCVIVESSDEESKLLTVSLNRLRGQTNEELLASLMTELAQHYSLDDLTTLTGVTPSQLDAILSDLEEDTAIEEQVEDDQFDVEQALGEIVEPETRRGEIWRLGRHTLMCGDSTSRDDVGKLMAGQKASLVVTDPPYNVAVKSDSEKLKADGRGQILNDDMPAEEFERFLENIFASYSFIMDDKAAIYVFHPSSYQREFEDAMNKAGIMVRTQCIWVKNAFSFGFAQYKYKHEPVFYAHLKGKAPAWYGDFKQTTVWKAGLPAEVPLPETVWEVSRGDVGKYVHPTQKPLDLLAIPIRNSSQQGDVVVDLFGGSGSTLMTCEQMGRTCFSMELDPVFCDVIKKRFFESTGIAPVRVTESSIAI